MQFDGFVLLSVSHLSFVDVVRGIDFSFDEKSEPWIVANERLVNRRPFEHRAHDGNELELTGQIVRIVEGLIDNGCQFQFQVFEEMLEVNEIVEKFLQSTARIVSVVGQMTARRTFDVGSSGSYFLLLMVSNSSLNCSKMLVINELSVLPLTPAQASSLASIRQHSRAYLRFRPSRDEGIRLPSERDPE